MILYMYIASGQGLTTLWGQNSDVSRNILSLWSFIASLKKISLKSWLYTIFFMILYMYIVPGQGQTAPRGQSFDVNKNVWSLHSFVASLKKMSLKSEFIHFFHDLIHVYSPRAGADSPQGGKKLDVNRKALSLYPFVASLKEISLKFNFIQFFFYLIQVYSQGQEGGYSPQGTKFWCQQKLLVTLVICC